jgi:hypothetical protein
MKIMKMIAAGPLSLRAAATGPMMQSLRVRLSGPRIITELCFRCLVNLSVAMPLLRPNANVRHHLDAVRVGKGLNAVQPVPLPLEITEQTRRPKFSRKAEKERRGIFAQIYHHLWTRNPRSIESLSWIGFVLLFTFVAVAGQGNDGYAFDMANDIRTLLSTFMDLQKSSDWWDFMSQTFLPFIYQSAWYNGDPLEQSELGLANLEYIIIGQIGVRQLRVRNDSCKLRYVFNGSNPGCFADFSSSAEDKTPYGPIDNATGRPVFQYSTAKQLGCTTACYVGAMYAVYPTSGFFEEFPPALGGDTSLANATEKLADLMAGRWIDRHTRAIFVEFALYSVTTNLLAPISLSLELPAGGGVIPFIGVSTIRAENLFPTATSSTAPLAAEALLLLLVLAYTGQAIREWRAAGTTKYWSDIWSVVDWLNFLLLYGAFGVRLSVFSTATKISFPPSPSDPTSFAQVGSMVELWKNLLGANAVRPPPNTLLSDSICLCTCVYLHVFFAGLGPSRTLSDFVRLCACVCLRVSHATREFPCSTLHGQTVQRAFSGRVRVCLSRDAPGSRVAVTARGAPARLCVHVVDLWARACWPRALRAGRYFLTISSS